MNPPLTVLLRLLNDIMRKDENALSETAQRASLGHRIARDLQRRQWKYILMIPILIYLILFCYKPMYGLIIAFKNYKPALGFAGSKWVGLKYFKKFFGDYYFFRILRNTFLISLYSILWGFPAPILLALMLNELRGERFKRTVQTVTYIPHFISMVVICSIIRQFCLSDGVFNDIGAFFGAQRTALLQKPGYFRTIYVATASGRRSAGARSSIWPRSPASICSSTRPPRSTARTACARRGTSRCPASCRRSSCC